MFSIPVCPMCGTFKVEEQIIDETVVFEFYEKHLEFSFEAPIFCCSNEGCQYAWPDERYHIIREDAMNQTCAFADTDKFNDAKLEITGMDYGS